MYLPGFDPWEIDLALYLYNFVLMSKKWLLSTLIYILSHYFYSYNFGRFVWAFVLEIFHSIWQHYWADAPRRNALFQQNAATPKSRVNRMCSERAAMSMCFLSLLWARVLLAVASSLALPPAPLYTREGKLRSQAELCRAKVNILNKRQKSEATVKQIKVN